MSHKPITVDDIIFLVTNGHMECYGGYPYDHLLLKNGDLIVASLDDAKDRNRTEVLYWTAKQIWVWRKEATQLLKSDVDLDVSECIEETRPPCAEPNP